NAGHISYIELDGDPVKNLDAFESVVRYMKECGIGYGSINHPVDRDPVCGYTGIIDDVCPRCGRREGEAVSVEKLKKLGVYKHLNASTLGCCGNADEEADRIPNTL
ncbi:MAG: anaerobic ribonucleoside triphosphate reductase, partial [Oscillospiraceae bacterium]|nr:anaerobic ribonucleoside triphosphate reductase [Oscillospiraceae bacterium]